MLAITINRQATDPDEILTDDFEADYVSLISDNTYGAPALVAPRDGKKPVCKEGESVLYVNPKFCIAIEVKRLQEEG